MSATVRNFVAVVTAHERLHELGEIVDAYLRLADKDTGIAEAEVISARPLDAGGRRTLEASIARLTGKGQVRATYREDPDLLGGAVIKVGSTVYDGSVRGQLEQMKHAIDRRGLALWVIDLGSGFWVSDSENFRDVLGAPVEAAVTERV